MKKIVSLLAILALVFAMVAFVGCDNGNGGTPANPDSDPITNGGTSDPVGGGDDETPAGETYTVVLDGTYTATENIYDNPSTQVKIATNIESLKVGDKVVLKMKGTASYEVATMEVCLVDATEAANWWTMLDENKWTENNVTDFDIDYTYTVTQAPIGTGSDSIMIAINAKGKTDTLTLDCSAKDDDDAGSEGDNNEGAGGEGDNNEGTEGTEPDPEPIGVMAKDGQIDLGAYINTNGVVAGDNVTVTIVLSVPTPGNKVQGKFFDNASDLGAKENNNEIVYEMETPGATEYIITGDIDGIGNWGAIQLWYSQEDVTVKSFTIVKR